MFPQGIPRGKEGRGGKWRVERGTFVEPESSRGGEQPQRALRTSFFVPNPIKLFKSSKQQEGQWSLLYQVISSFSGKDQFSGSCSSKEGEKEKENGRRRKKNLLGPISVANMITWLPGSSASCWQASWSPASYAQLPVPPRPSPD